MNYVALLIIVEQPRGVQVYLVKCVLDTSL